MKCRVLVDFDGTIARLDTTDHLLERFALPEWTAIEEDWKAGRIGSRECLLRQVDLVRATPEEYEDFVSSIEIDPAFPAFVTACMARDMDVMVVSDGLDRTVGAVLRRSGLELPYKANHLEWLGGDRWRLSFPNARGDCKALSGNCKCQFADSARGAVRIVIGDGRSDFCVAERADLVLAKGALAAHSRTRALPHVEIHDFDDATRFLVRWFDRQAEAPHITGQLGDE